MLFVLLVFVGIFRISPVNATDGTNNSPETAIELLPGQQISTSIDYKGDQDWYKINVSDTSSIASTISNNSGGVWYELYDESLNSLHVTSVVSTKIDSWKVNQGVYYIKISDFSGVNYLTSSITLKVDIIQEDLWENNDSSNSAVEVIAGQELTGISIEAKNDEDWFKINISDTSSIASIISNNSGGVWFIFKISTVINQRN